jgi:hypothetical protein
MEDDMSSTMPSDRALRLRLEAARMQARALPDLVQRAYGEPGPEEEAANTRVSTQSPEEVRDAARTALVERGYLTPEELETLAEADALGTARERLRAQVADLEAQAGSRGGDRRGQETFKRPPKTIRR